MVRLAPLFALCTSLFAAASALPAELNSRTLSDAEIIDALQGVGLVKQIHSYITLESLTTNLISVNFDVENPLPIDLTVDSVAATAGVNGATYASFTHTFSTPLVVPAFGTANSGEVSNVLLTQGAIATLDILNLGVLDLKADAQIHAGTSAISLVGLEQTGVPTSYDLILA